MKTLRNTGKPVRESVIQGLRLLAMFLTAFGVSHAGPQALDRTVEVSSECAGRIQKATAEVEAGQLAEADATLVAALTKTDDHTAAACTGLILHNRAAIASMSGRFLEGERLAMGAIAALERAYSPEHLALLRPLLVLAGARLEQGNKSGARIAFGRIKLIRAQLPPERAMIHAMSGSLLQSVGDRRQAETEYLGALDAWAEIGRGETADAGAVLTSLGVLYTQEGRFEEAAGAVDRAAVVLSKAKDAFPMDRSKLLAARAMLHARLGEWPEAEKNYREGLRLADGQPGIGTAYVLSLLNGLAEALKKIHRRQEARAIEARAAALRSTGIGNVVDLSDLIAPAKRKK
jgi:tetratricopeptide (TPR) repeat protein